MRELISRIFWWQNLVKGTVLLMAVVLLCGAAALVGVLL